MSALLVILRKTEIVEVFHAYRYGGPLVSWALISSTHSAYPLQHLLSFHSVVFTESVVMVLLWCRKSRKATSWRGQTIGSSTETPGSYVVMTSCTRYESTEVQLWGTFLGTHPTVIISNSPHLSRCEMFVLAVSLCGRTSQTYYTIRNKQRAPLSLYSHTRTASWYARVLAPYLSILSSH